jgi:hypothetical protein
LPLRKSTELFQLEAHGLAQDGRWHPANMVPHDSAKLPVASSFKSGVVALPV